MPDKSKRPRLVGTFIRQKREAANLSQRALGQLFSPPVTTQFISNLERGVTPLPLNHVPVLTKALSIDEAELRALLEQEYTLKISGRLSQIEGFQFSAVDKADDDRAGDLPIANEDLAFMKLLYEAYRRADIKTRQTFHSVCESMLALRK
jgi:transcriptional regulator with XRE-family HTH domain